MLLLVPIVALLTAALFALGMRWIIHSPKREDRHRDRGVAMGCYIFLALTAATFGTMALGLLLMLNGQLRLAFP